MGLQNAQLLKSHTSSQKKKQENGLAEFHMKLSFSQLATTLTALDLHKANHSISYINELIHLISYKNPQP